MPTLTGSLADLGIGDLDERGIVEATLEANTPGFFTSDGTLHLDKLQAQVTGGALSITNIPSTDALTGLRLQLHLNYPALLPGGQRKRSTWSSGWFPFTADATLSEVASVATPQPVAVETVQEAIDAAAGGAVAQVETARDDAQASATAAAGLATTAGTHADAAAASATAAAGSATAAGTAQADAESARDEAQAAAATATAPTDATMAAKIQDPTSATASALNEAIATTSDGRYALIPTTVPTTARQVLVSTDMDTDCGDVPAIEQLLFWERAGYLDILAIAVDVNSPTGSPVVDAICRKAGRVLQVGQNSATYNTPKADGTFHAAVLAAAGTDTVVHRASDQYPDAVSLWRHALEHATGPVDIITIGTLGVLHGLLLSPADAISASTGVQLVAAKVRHLWTMGGQYPTGTEHNFSLDSKAAAAASYVAANWPDPAGWTNTDDPYVTFFGVEAADTVIAHTTLAATVPPTNLSLTALAAYQLAAGHGPEEGRPAWDELTVRMAALDSTADAGYTTVRGTNAVNSASGANTFTASATGPHEYVVKAQPDSYYAAAIDALNIRGQEPVPPGSHWRTQPVGSSIPRLDPATAPAKPQGLAVVARMCAADAALVPGVVDGSLAASMPSRGGVNGPTWVLGGTGQAPTYRASIGGRACLQFAGAQALASAVPVAFGTDLTVLARVRFDTVPAAVQAIAAADNGSPRVWQLKTGTTGQIQAINFNAGNGRTDTSAAGLILANTWQLIVMRYDSTTLEGLVDGATDGATTTSGAANAGSQRITIGAGNTSLGSPLTGYIADLKVVAGKATDTQIGYLALDM